MSAMDIQLDSVTQRLLLARTARAQRDGRLPSLSVAVGDDRQMLWSAGRGRVHGERPTTDTQYRMGSITKTFTAVLVMQLRDEGRLRLSDHVDRWLPAAGGLAGRSVAEMLSHTGGVRAETSPPWWERAPGRSWEELVTDLDAHGTRDGTRGLMHYSNVGYAVLGELVAQLRGRAWWDVLSERILQPLELSRTTVMPAPPAADGWAVHPWSDTLIAEPAYDSGAMAPAGQLWSTAGDLATWGRFLLGDTGDVLSPSTLEELLQPRVPNGRTPSEAYGLGLEIRTTNERTIAGHGGSMPGFVAQLGVDREAQLAVVALANATTGLSPTLLDDLLGTVRERHPRIVDDWEPRTAGGAADELLGVWYWGPRPYTIAASAQPDVLTLDAVGAPGRNTRLDLRAEQWVGCGGYFDGEPLVVRRGHDGSVTHLELASFVFTREPYEPAAVIPGGVAKD